jgi:hypothetical protein
MAQITKDITVDVAKKNLFQALVAKQNDNNSRFLKVTICNEGTKIEVPSTATVLINAERADNSSKAFAGTVNSDGTVTVPLTNWMLGLDDIVRCSISVIGSDEQKLTSTSFSIDVEAAEYEGSDITDDENYDVLITLISDVSDAKLACETATIAANSATELAQGAATAANDAATAAASAATAAEEISDFYGSPLVALTAADMTQTNRIYVYTGTEDGYTSGNWYYYNGSAWVSGGVYNSSTVARLLVADTDNNKNYQLTFSLTGGKPVINYEEM